MAKFGTRLTGTASEIGNKTDPGDVEEYIDEDAYLDGPSLSDTVERTASAITLAGLAFFGGLRLNRGLSAMSFREKIDAFLVKRNILEPDPKTVPKVVRPNSSKTTIDVWYGHKGNLGPGIPGTEGEWIFGPYEAAQEAFRVKINQQVTDVLKGYRATLSNGSPRERQNALNAIADVVRKTQTRSILGGGIVSDINVEDIYILPTGEYDKVLKKLATNLEDLASHPDVAKLATDLRDAHKRFVERMPLENVDKPGEFETYVIDDAALDALEGVGMTGRGVVNANNVNLEVQKEIWSARGGNKALASRELESLNTALAEAQVYDGGITLLDDKGFKNITNNRYELKKTLDIWRRAEGVESVGLVDVKTLKTAPLVPGDPTSAREHQVAVIRITARSPVDSRRVVDLREIPLLSKFNTFAMGKSSNIYASIFHVPEARWDKTTRTIRPGGRKDDVFTAHARYNQILEGRVDMEVREMIEGTVLPGGTISTARSLNRRNLTMAYGDDARILTSQNLYDFSLGARLKFGAMDIALEPQAIQAKRRLSAIDQFSALKKGWGNREKIFIDIETLSEDPTAIPNVKVDHSDIYQVSAIKTDARGNVVTRKTWWVNSKKKFTEEWIRHTYDTTDAREIGEHLKWMTRMKNNGLEIHQVMNEVGEMMRGVEGAEPAQIITHYGKESDMPTIRRIVDSIQRVAGPGKKITQSAYGHLMQDKVGTLIDTWEMTSAAMHGTSESLELMSMAKNVYGINIEKIEKEYRAAFRRSINDGTDEVSIGIKSIGRKDSTKNWEKYIHQHQSLYDAHITMATVIAIMEEKNNPVSKVLGNKKQEAYYRKLISSTQDPADIAQSLNIATLMSEMGVDNFIDEITDVFKIGGHPHTMAKGILNAMTLSDLIPFGQFYTAWRRGSGHKRLNTARFHDDTIKKLMGIDPNIFYPNMVTEKMMELLPDANTRAHTVGHFVNATIAYSNSRFSISSNVLVDKMFTGAKVQFRQNNYRIQLPSATGAKIIGKSIGPPNLRKDATIEGIGRTKGMSVWGSGSELNPNEYLIIQYTDMDGAVQYTSHQYTGHRASIVRDEVFHSNTSEVVLDRDLIQDFRTGSKGTVLGSNVTMEEMRQPFYRMGKGSTQNIDAGRRINVLASWKDEGTAKYYEMGRHMEQIMGKLTAPLLKAARGGNTDATNTLKRMLGVLTKNIKDESFLELREVNFDTNFAQDMLKKGHSPEVLTIVESRLNSVLNRNTAMNELVNWNTLTEAYTLINELIELDPSAIPDYERYIGGRSRRGNREIHAVRSEMFNMSKMMDADIKTITLELDAEVILQKTNRTNARQDTIRELRGERDVLLADKKALGNFIDTHIKAGGYKFYENILQGGRFGEELVSFVTVGPAAISRKDPEDLMGLFPMFEDSFDFAGNPVGKIPIRPQSIELLDAGMKGINVAEEYRNVILGGIRRQLGMHKYPALALKMADLDYVFGDMPNPKDTWIFTRKKGMKELKTQVDKINAALESVKIAQESTDSIFVVKNLGDTSETWVTDVTTEEQAISEIRRKEGDIDKKLNLVATKIPKGQLGVLASEVDPELIKDTILWSRVPIAIQIPEHIRRHVTVDFKAIEKELLTSMSGAKVEHIMQVVEGMFGQGKEEIRIPALGLSGRSMITEHGTAKLSELQLAAHNMALRLVDASSGNSQQTFSALTEYVSKYYHEMAKFMGRHRDSGKAATAFMPGQRGILQPMGAAGFMQVGGENPLEGWTSKYNKFQSTAISRAQAEASGIDRALLEMGMHKHEVEQIMSGKKPQMRFLQREPVNFTTSILAVERWIIPNEDFIGKKIKVGTKHVAGLTGIMRVTQEFEVQGRADFDSDAGSYIEIPTNNMEEYRVMERATKEVYEKQKESYLRSEKFRSSEFIIETGSRNKRGEKRILIRQLIMKGEGAGEVRYVEFDDLLDKKVIGNTSLDEIAFMRKQIGEGFQVGTSEYKLHTMKKSAKHLDVNARAAEDAAVSAILDSQTGKITAATWQLRTAFDIIRQSGKGKYLNKAGKEVDIFAGGETYPGQLVPDKVTGKMIPASEIRGIISAEAINDPNTMIFEDIMGEIIDTTTISKRKTSAEAARDINFLSIANNPAIPIEERIESLMSMSAVGKGFLGKNQATLIADLVDAFHGMEGSDVLKTMYKNITAATAPQIGQVLDLLDILRKKHGQSMTFGVELLLAPWKSAENRAGLAQFEAEVAQRGTMEPMYFSKRSFRRMIADEAGIELTHLNRNLRFAGVGLAAAAGVNFLFPETTDWFLGGDAQGFGGERYDYFGKGAQIPNQVPLSVPEYSWDTRVHTYPNSESHRRKQDYATFNYKSQPSMGSTYTESSGANYPTGYSNYRSYPSSTDNMQRRQQPLNPFIGR